MSTFKDLYNADLYRFQGKPGFYMKVFYFLYRKSMTIDNLFYKRVLNVLFRIWTGYRGLEISTLSKIGGGLYLGHAYNITINPKAIIGKNCNIHKGVVIGQTNRGLKAGVPNIGNNVWIGINSAIVGNIIIGDDVLIAPNSFVNCDVPAHSVVFGNPCIIKHRDFATENYINNCI